MTQHATRHRQGLQDAFQQYNDLFTHLADSYGELQKRVADLTAVLQRRAASGLDSLPKNNALLTAWSAC